MPLVIKRKVSLEFLGEDYKDSYITFKSIPVGNFQDITKKVEEIGEDNIKSIAFIVEILQKYFIEGKAGEDVLKSEDLQELDAETTIKCFEVLSGQSVDPKDEAPLTTPSPTTDTT